MFQLLLMFDVPDRLPFQNRIIGQVVLEKIFSIQGKTTWTLKRTGISLDMAGRVGEELRRTCPWGTDSIVKGFISLNTHSRLTPEGVMERTLSKNQETWHLFLTLPLCGTGQILPLSKLQHIYLQKLIVSLDNFYL